MQTRQIRGLGVSFLFFFSLSLFFTVQNILLHLLDWVLKVTETRKRAQTIQSVSGKTLKKKCGPDALLTRLSPLTFGIKSDLIHDMTF